jgi:hypothetical protein
LPLAGSTISGAIECNGQSQPREPNTQPDKLGGSAGRRHIVVNYVLCKGSLKILVFVQHPCRFADNNFAALRSFNELKISRVSYRSRMLCDG